MLCTCDINLFEIAKTNVKLWNQKKYDVIAILKYLKGKMPFIIDNINYLPQMFIEFLELSLTCGSKKKSEACLVLNTFGEKK